MNAYVKKALRSPSFMILLCLSIILILIPIFAPQLAPHDPLETNYAASMVEHSPEYPMGTDQIGRCILSRLIWGGRTSLLIVFCVVAIVASPQEYFLASTALQGFAPNASNANNFSGVTLNK